MPPEVGQEKRSPTNGALEEVSREGLKFEVEAGEIWIVRPNSRSGDSKIVVGNPGRVLFMFFIDQ